MLLFKFRTPLNGLDPSGVGGWRNKTKKGQILKFFTFSKLNVIIFYQFVAILYKIIFHNFPWNFTDIGRQGRMYVSAVRYRYEYIWTVMHFCVSEYVQVCLHVNS